MSPESKKDWWPIVAIMLGVLAWGVYHAVGAYMANHDYRKPLIVLAFLFAFLGFWAVMLFARSRRPKRES